MFLPKRRKPWVRPGLAINSIAITYEISRLLGFACLISTSALPAPINSENTSRYVIAHWIVPMNYEPNETDRDRVSDDIKAALEEGLDGFAINAFSGKQANAIFQTFTSVADQMGAKRFKLFLSADVSLGFSPTEIVDIISRWAENPHYLRVNGKPLLSTYGTSKLDSSGWKSQVLEPLRKAGKMVSFVPFLDRPNANGDDPSYQNWQTILLNYPVIDGLFNFGITASPPFYLDDNNLGNHKWSFLQGEENLAKALHDRGKIFIAPYIPCYWAVCHPARQYIEFQAGRGMDNLWRSIIEKQKPDAVEIITWNDYSESSFVQPTRIPQSKTEGIESYPHLGYYELLKYYIAWYRDGMKPEISNDALFYFYRPYLRSNPPTEDVLCSLGPVSKRQLWGNVRDVIYITTALKSPAELRIYSGNKRTNIKMSKGLTTTDVSIEDGKQRIELWRGGIEILYRDGMPTSSHRDIENLNVYSGYAISNGANSESWIPSDEWRDGVGTKWFKP